MITIGLLIQFNSIVDQQSIDYQTVKTNLAMITQT